MSDLINLTGLWTPREPGSRVVMSGANGGVRYLIFKNDRWEEGSNMPKYNLCIAQVEKKQTERTDVPDGEEEMPF